MFIYIKKSAQVLSQMTNVHFLSITFPGCLISQLRAVKTDMILGSGGVKDKKSPAAADEEQACSSKWILQSVFLFLFYFSLLLIIHKGDHPLSEPLSLFLQGQKEWPVALYGGDFYDVVRAVWRPPVLLSLVTGATVAPRKGPSCMGNVFHCFEVLGNLATAQSSFFHHVLVTRLQNAFVSLISFNFINRLIVIISLKILYCTVCFHSQYDHQYEEK